MFFNLCYREKDCVVRDACSKHLIIMRSHDLHADNIRGTMCEIASYHKRD